MLLQRLVEYVDRLDDALPAGYARNNVRYEIYLDGAGRLLSSKPLDLASKENKAGQNRPVPYVRRSGTQPPPMLLADHAEFTLGWPRVMEDAAKAKAQAQVRHNAYMQLIERCVADTQDSAVAAVHTFLSSSPLAQLELGEEFAPTGTIEFVVNGQRATERPAVRSFWADYNAQDDNGITMQCVVCNRQRPTLDRLPGVIKGIPGGNATGTSLISANADAFESYGLKASQVAPICAECAEKFTNALNVLLASRRHRLGIQDMAYIFWTREEAGFEFTGWFDTPDPEKVRELIEGARKGRFDKDLDQTAYYALALTANNARAVVRDWLDTTVGQVKSNLAHWFARQAIVGGYGEEPAPLKLYALAAATVRDPKKELSSQTTAALLRAALTGTPLPDRLLQQAVRRCQVERDVTRPRAALLKLVLLSNSPDSQEDFMIELQPDHPDAAYHCGRLLAVLETIQRRSADGQLNTTLVDRFYGTASSAPASVFGTLIRGAQPHIAKLRKTKTGLAVRLEQEMEEVLSGIAVFPATLTVKRQALFALGYYHQRAFDRAQAKEAGQQKQRRAAELAAASAYPISDDTAYDYAPTEGDE
jgi:CRISPR-associated protein Csd1